MEISAIITSLIAVVGLVYSAIRIAHDKAPLRRYERLAATREQLEPGSRTLKLTDRALLDLARSIAYKESGEGQIRVVQITFAAILLVGTLTVVASTELNDNEEIPKQVVNFLFISGMVYFGVSLLALATIMITQFVMWMTLWRYRRVRRLIKRSRARQAKRKRKDLKPQAMEKLKALKARGQKGVGARL